MTKIKLFSFSTPYRKIKTFMNFGYVQRVYEEEGGSRTIREGPERRPVQAKMD